KEGARSGRVPSDSPLTGSVFGLGSRRPALRTHPQPGALACESVRRTGTRFTSEAISGRQTTARARILGIPTTPALVRDAEAADLIDRLPAGTITSLDARAAGISGMWIRIRSAEQKNIAAHYSSAASP